MNRPRIAMSMTLTALLALGLALAAPALAQGQPVFQSGTLVQGATFTWKAAEPGTYAYHCGIHPSMKGSITVTAGDGMGQTVDVAIRDFRFEPANITVPSGATVRWTNFGSASHTVVADGDGMMKDNGSVTDEGTMDEGESMAKSTPGLAVGALLAGLAAVAMALRRREA